MLKNAVSFLAIFGLAFAGICAPVSAQDISVQAEVDKATVSLGSMVRLIITAKGVNALQPVELPPIEGFESRYVGPRSQILIINGQYSRTISFIYNLYPLQVGEFTIPAITIPIEGKEYQTQPIALKVIDAPSGSGGASSGPGGLAGPTSAVKLQDKLFVVMSVAKKEAWMGEKIPVTIKLFVDDLTVQDIEFPKFDHEGFSMDDYQEPRRYEQVVGGVQYEVVEFRTTVSPTRTGDLTLGPAKIPCQVLFRSEESALDSLGGGMFDSDLFKGFFSTYEAHPMVLESAPVPLIVLPLPEGQPKSFSGAVGQFDFQVTVSPSEIRVGDPITVRMRLSGSGDWKSAAIPSLKDTDQFKTYEPQIHQDEQGKVLEQVVIPKTAEMKEIEAIEFGYFDTTTQQYQMIRQGPFPLTVKPAEDAGQPMTTVVPSGAPPAPLAALERFGQDISFIKDRPGEFQPVGYRVYKNLSFWMAVWLLLAFWVTGWIWHQTRHRLKIDEKLARRLQAPRQARRGLAQAEEYLRRGEQKLFYDMLFKTLQHYFANKFHLSTGINGLQTLQSLLASRNLNSGIAEKLQTIFAECERVRYASLASDPERMKANHQLTEEIIDFLERNWR